MNLFFRRLIFAMCIVAIPLAALAGSTWSAGRYLSGTTIKKNPFPSGQCTWYVDGKTDVKGWDIVFKRSSNRDAYKWYSESLILNSNRGNLGYPGDIMVFDKGSYSSVGHVAYVTSQGTWNRKKAWTVRHANWGSSLGQTNVEKIDGYTIKQCTFVEVSANPRKVSIVYKNSSGKEVLGSSTYPVLGFLYKK